MKYSSLILSLISKLNILIDLPSFIFSRICGFKKNKIAELNESLEYDKIKPFTQDEISLSDQLSQSEIYQENEDQRCQVQNLFGETYFGGPFLIINSISRDRALMDKSSDYTYKCLHCGKCNTTDFDVPKIVEQIKSSAEVPSQYRETILKFRDNILSCGNIFANTVETREIKKYEYAFFPGCLTQKRGEFYINKIMDFLSDSGFHSFPIYNQCCANPLKWFGLNTGYEGKFISYLNKLKVKKIFFSCPHCYMVVKRESVNFEAVFLYEILKDNFVGSNDLYFFQLPCAMRNENKIISDISQNLKKSELHISDGDNFTNFDCCGGGGGYILLQEEQARALTFERYKNIGNSAILTMCPWCHLTITNAGYRAFELYELWKKTN